MHATSPLCSALSQSSPRTTRDLVALIVPCIILFLGFLCIAIILRYGVPVYSSHLTVLQRDVDEKERAGIVTQETADGEEEEEEVVQVKINKVH